MIGELGKKDSPELKTLCYSKGARIVSPCSFEFFRLYMQLVLINPGGHCHAGMFFECTFKV